MYYLQSRYYDPAIGRFVNSDAFASTNVLGFLSCNMFAYCLNNPVCYVDYSGCNTTASAIEWGTSMWWLTLVDGPIPIGDFVYLAGLAFIGTGLLVVVDVALKNNYNSSNSSKSDGAHNYEEQTAYVVGYGSSAAPPPQKPNNNNSDKQKNGTPKNNQAQNKQARDAAKKANLSKYQQRIFHDEIHGQNRSYKELEEIAFEIKGLFSK